MNTAIIVAAMPLASQPVPLDHYHIHTLHYDVVITIGDYAVDSMMAEVVIALTTMGLLDPPLC